MANLKGHSLGGLFKNRREKGEPHLPLLSVTMSSGLVRRQSLERKTESTLDAEQHLLVRKGDIAYNMMRMWQGAFGLATEDGMVSPAYVVLAPTNKIDPLYCFYLFKTPRLRYLFWAYSYGLTDDRLRLYYKDFAKIVVTIPHLDEQRAVGLALQRWDKRIAVVERWLSLTEVLKRGLMQVLLTGKCRLQEHADKSWLPHRLGDLFVERDETNHDDLPLLSITAERGVIRREDIERKDPSSEDKGSYKRILPGDIGYNTMRMWQGISGLSRLEGIVSPAYTICVPKDEIDARFAAHLFKYPPIIHLFHRYSQGLVDDTLALKFPNFAQVKVTIPPVDEQISVATKLSLITRYIELMRTYLDNLRAQKRGLMQKLVTESLSESTVAALAAETDSAVPVTATGVGPMTVVVLPG
jgi:type I restriction enzyme S subunit